MAWSQFSDFIGLDPDPHSINAVPNHWLYHLLFCLGCDQDRWNLCGAVDVRCHPSCGRPGMINL